MVLGGIIGNGGMFERTVTDSEELLNRLCVRRVSYICSSYHILVRQVSYIR